MLISRYVRSCRIAQRQGAPSWYLRSALSLAQINAGRGAHDVAFHLLAPIHGRFTEGFDTWDLQVGRRMLRALELEQVGVQRLRIDR